MSSIINPSEQLRVWYSAEHGWLVDVVEALPDAAMTGVVAKTLQIQEDRLRGLMPGDRRDECLTTIRRLKTEGVRQRVLTTRDGAAAFKSHAAIGDKRYFFFGTSG